MAEQDINIYHWSNFVSAYRFLWIVTLTVGCCAGWHPAIQTHLERRSCAKRNCAPDQAVQLASWKHPFPVPK